MNTVEIVTAVIGAAVALLGAFGGLVAWMLKSQLEAFRTEIRSEIRALDRSLTAEVRGLAATMDARLTALERTVWPSSS